MKTAEQYIEDMYNRFNPNLQYSETFLRPYLDLSGDFISVNRDKAYYYSCAPLNFPNSWGAFYPSQIYQYDDYVFNNTLTLRDFHDTATSYGFIRNFQLNPQYDGHNFKEDYFQRFTNKSITLYFKKFKDVYNKSSLSNIVDANGRAYTVDSFWNTFQDYLVPVVQPNAHNYEVGTKILFYPENTSKDSMLVFLNPTRATDFKERTVLTIEGSPIIYRKKGNWQGRVLVVGEGISLMPSSMVDIKNTFIYNCFTGCEPFYQRIFGNYDYVASVKSQTLFKRAEFFGEVRRCESVVYLQEHPTDVTPNEVMEIDSNRNALYNSRDVFYQMQTYSDGIPLSYRNYGLSNLDLYSEEKTPLERTFKFNYSGIQNKLGIVCYNQADFENYLNVFEIPFEYYRDWVEPLRPSTSFNKIRREDTILLTTATSQKLRREDTMLLTTATGNKIRR